MVSPSPPEQAQPTGAWDPRDEHLLLVRSLVNDVRDYAIFLLDPQGRVSSWNSGAQAIKGYAAEEIIGSHISRFYPPEAVARGWPDYELQVATREGRFEDEGWRLRKDGTPFWANVVITALRDETGTLRGFSKITRDLTERRKHEEVLRQSEQRFRLLIEGVRDYALLMLDTGGIVTSWNSGAERIKGYRAGEIIGRHFSNFYRAEDVAASKPWRQLALARESGRVEDEGWRVRRDGSVFWAKVVITRLDDSQGGLYGYAHLTQDLTQQRHAEALEDAARRINEFIAMLAHELRNPLAPIRNAVALMEKKGLGDPVLEAMRQTIDRQSSQLARIVDDLLDVNRIARGQLVVERELLDLCDVVMRAVEASRPLIERRRHALHLSLPAQPVRLSGDTLRLTQLVVNLLNNAAKYTPESGNIWLRVLVRHAYVELRVRDDGVGIEPEMLGRIFDLFVQGRETLDHAEGGLGVGLALVRRVAELHGGGIDVHSEGHGRGSEFVVTLPLPVQESAPESVPILPELPVSLPHRRIVLADDNVDAAESLGLLLESLGQEVRLAHDGIAAVDAVEQFRPDVVMLDIGMPKLDGYEAARMLRASPAGPGLVLVAITGWGQEADRLRAAEAGFDYHLVKPTSEAALREILASLAVPQAS